MNLKECFADVCQSSISLVEGMDDLALLEIETFEAEVLQDCKLLAGLDKVKTFALDKLIQEDHAKRKT